MNRTWQRHDAPAVSASRVPASTRLSSPRCRTCGDGQERENTRQCTGRFRDLDVDTVQRRREPPGECLVSSERGIKWSATTTLAKIKGLRIPARSMNVSRTTRFNCHSGGPHLPPRRNRPLSLGSLANWAWLVPSGMLVPSGTLVPSGDSDPVERTVIDCGGRVASATLHTERMVRLMRAAMASSMPSRTPVTRVRMPPSTD